MFRGLRADEIEVRVGTVGTKGVTLLLYKDARCDMNILDEELGSENWQRDHKVIKDNMFCGIGIYNKTVKDWVWKWDCGTESNTEKEKGEASDSFKRACFNLGIGRELYTGGFIFVSCDTTETAPNSKKFKLNDLYQFNGAKATKVTYDETKGRREIAELEISDKKGNVIFRKGGYEKPVARKETVKPKEEVVKVTNEEENALREEADAVAKMFIDGDKIVVLEAKMKAKGVPMKELSRIYSVETIEEIRVGQFVEAMRMLETMKDKPVKARVEGL